MCHLFEMEQSASLMTRIIGAIFYVGPLIFAFGFIAPLISQILKRSGYVDVFGWPPVVVGLVLAAIWGGIAQYRGRWI